MNKKYWFLGFLLMSAVLFSCKEKEEGTPVTLKFNFKYGGQPLVYDQEYSYDTDKTIKIELVKFYFSNPSLVSESGETVKFSDDYYLVELDKNIIQAGRFPLGNYTALNFGLGVDNTRNVETDPQAIPATDYPNDHPLNASFDMWWTWATGYIFVKVEGRIDANGNGIYTDLEDKTISYHPGVSELYRTVSVNKSFTVMGDDTQFDITLNVEKMFDEVDLLTFPYAHPNSVDHPEYTYANRMMNGFVNAFE
ncbi:MAG: hypothetical protein MH137_09920 [Flavobacteriales bacterium]|nr:hypothetical protein [Flavobacteriales bacterium]